MSPNEVLGAARDMMMITLLLVSPFLAVAMLASLVVGLVQASTKMNDLTLSFVPRFLAVMLVIYVSATWASGHMTAYIGRSAAAMRHIVQ
jgi:flagellar biosynthetic protein FliQ